PVHWYALLHEAPTAGDSITALKEEGMMVACRLDGEEPSLPPGVDLPIYDANGRYASRLMHRLGPTAASAVGWWRWDAGAATALENRLRCGALLWRSGLSGALVQIGPERSSDPAWPLRWDGVRQGILDSRFLTTLFAFTRQVKDMDRSNRLPGQAEEAVSAAL